MWRCSEALRDVAFHGLRFYCLWRGGKWCDEMSWCCVAWHDVAWHGVAGRDVALRGMVLRGMAWCCVAWCCGA